MITASVQMCVPPDEESKKKLFFILQTDVELERRTLVARCTLSAPLKRFEMRARARRIDDRFVEAGKVRHDSDEVES